MHLHPDHYTAQFEPSAVAELYADWNWLINAHYLSKPWLMSRFGDLFFEAPDGSIQFLDTLEGTITPFAENKKAAEQKISDPEIQKRYLTSETVALLEERGMKLKEGELYIYVPHPSVVGKVDVNSIQVMSMNVVISIYGQLLGQMRH